jgi:hypothetical protein
MWAMSRFWERHGFSRAIKKQHNDGFYSLMKDSLRWGALLALR